jgi:hypothetical protein
MPNPPTLEYLFTITANLREGSPVIANGPLGTRVIVTVIGGSFEGPKLRGTVDNSGGDWVTLRPDQSIKLDVRIMLKTEDGADIFMRYEGIGVREDGTLKLATAPLFETGDERYAWLNNVQAITTGSSAGGVVTYDVYAARP